MKSKITVPCVLGVLGAIGVVAASGATAEAAPALRIQVTQHGDFLFIGNTLGYDCDPGTPSPVVGTLAADACNQSTADLDDSSPDVYWAADTPAVGQCTADTSYTAAMAQSTAVLNVPAGATITNAYLYWSAVNKTNVAGTAVTLNRVGTGGFGPTTVTAVQSWLPGTDNAYQSVADITSLVQQYGSGAYRVSGIEVAPFANLDVDVLYGGWAIVAFYDLASDPVRNLALFDGLDLVSAKTGPSAATLTGFLVPNAGFDGKLGVLAWEGDNQATGDSLYFNNVQLSNTLNPANNFFNSTRTWLDVGAYATGDLPQLTGGPQSTAGVDIDVVDITSALTMGQTSAPIKATTTLDTYYLGAFITSISTYGPDFSTSTKTAANGSAGVYIPGDVVTYTITAINTGNDTAVNTTVNDPLPPELTYVPGSIAIDGTPQTDQAGDDEAEYVAGTATVAARIGTGATATAGGSLAPGASSVVTFKAKINAGVLGPVSNQASITAGGAKGSPETTYVTTGNGTVMSGNPPTVINVNQCATNADCSPPTPVCNTGTSPQVCVQCLMDSDCGGPMSGVVCNTAGGADMCEPGCRGMDGNGCPTGQMCSSTTPMIGSCSPISSGASSSSSSSSSASSSASSSSSSSSASSSSSSSASSSSSSSSSSASSSSASSSASSASSGASSTASSSSGTGGRPSSSTSGAGGAGGGEFITVGNGIACSASPSSEGRSAWMLGAALALLGLRRRRD